MSLLPPSIKMLLNSLFPRNFNALIRDNPLFVVGIFIISIQGPEGATLDYTDKIVTEVESKLKPYSDDGEIFTVIKNKEDNYIGEFVRGLKVESGISIEKFFNTNVNELEDFMI